MRVDQLGESTLADQSVALSVAKSHLWLLLNGAVRLLVIALTLFLLGLLVVRCRASSSSASYSISAFVSTFLVHIWVYHATLILIKYFSINRVLLLLFEEALARGVPTCSTSSPMQL